VSDSGLSDVEKSDSEDDTEGNCTPQFPSLLFPSTLFFFGSIWFFGMQSVLGDSHIGWLILVAELSRQTSSLLAQTSKDIFQQQQQQQQEMVSPVGEQAEGEGTYSDSDADSPEGLESPTKL
jgi:hypothetical protein